MAALQISSAKKNYDVPYFDKSPEVDGYLNEPLWQKALKIELDIETNPADNQPAPVKTTAYLYENGEQLFVAFDARDPHPEQIRAYYRDRDTNFNDDNVGIIIDPSNNRNLAYEFFSNALGVQLDLTEDDLNKKESANWDGIWDSAGTINEKGFIVEMAIPFRLLRIKQSQGPKTFAFEVLRFYQRDFSHRISNNVRDRNIRCHLCQLNTIQGFETVDTGNDLQLIPSLVVSHEKTRDTDNLPSQWDKNTSFEPGFDVRWGINTDLTLNATLNPDFSQVEADASQVSINNRFALFFPEKRAFFLEGADFFSSQSRLLHTRLISDPDWGVKLTQESGNSNWAIFSANDKATTLMLPGNQSSELAEIDIESTNTAFRYNHRFYNKLNLGTLVTNREGKDFSSTMSSIDGRWDINEQQQLSAQFMHSDSHYPDFFIQDEGIVDDNGNPKDNFNGNAYKLTYEYRSRDWVTLLKHTAVQKDFRADLGFITKADFRRNQIFSSRIWYGVESDSWNKFEINAEIRNATTISGDLLEKEQIVRFDLDAALQSTTVLALIHKTENFNLRQFDLNKGRLFFKISPSASTQFEIFAKFGDEIDFTNTQPGNLLSLSPKFSINIGRHWIFKVNHTFQRLDVDGGELFHVNQTDLKLTWQKDNKTSVRLTTQYQNVKRDPALYIDAVEPQSKDLNLQLLYSYKINPQTLIFAGLNTGRTTPEGIRSLKAFEQLFFMKFSYSWLG